MKIFDNKIVQGFILLCVGFAAGFAVKNYVDSSTNELNSKNSKIDKRLADIDNKLKALNYGDNVKNHRNVFYRICLKESLRKYRYVFDKKYEVPKNYVNKYPNRIWVYWDKGFEKAPTVVKRCLDSIKKHSAGRIVETLDENNFDKYVKIPDCIIKKYKEGKIPKAILADIIRTLLLRDYGGTWIDATTYLIADIPQYIFDAELFAPLEFYINDAQAKDFFDCRGHTIINNFFLSTNAPHNRFFQCMAEFLIEAWGKMEGVPYLAWFGFASIASEEDPVISKMFYNLYNNENKINSKYYFSLSTTIRGEGMFDKKKLKEMQKFPIQKFASSDILSRSSGKVKPGSFLDKLLKGELN